MTENAVYWLARHELSPAQIKAIQVLHGEDVIIVRDGEPYANLHVFRGRLATYHRQGGFSYFVAPAHYAIAATELGIAFGLFENHPAKRADGSFGLAAVWHFLPGHGIKKVWENPDPLSDQGEALVPNGR